MKLKFLLFAALVTVVLTACNYSKEYKPVNANNKFSISVPSWVKEDDKLKPGADFQYANRYRNFYAIGEALPKSDSTGFINTLNHNIDVLKKSMTNGIVSDSNAVSIAGLSGVRVEVFGKMGTENIYFSEVLLQGSNNVYHLSIWTRGEDRKLKFKDDIDRIFNSFKPL